MIKLERNLTPLCLAPSAVKVLIAKFKATKESVWNIDDLKWGLLSSSHHKCAYCECKLGEESKYLEVEHFKDKESYPDDVVTWTNLLPSCKRCNAKKGSHDVCAEPIVNPYETDPKSHLGFRLYRLKALTPLGQTTIDSLDLNNYERVLTKRFEVGELLHQALEIAMDRLVAYKSSPSTRNRNRLTGQVTSILLECLADKEYAATAATVVSNETDFINLRAAMKSLHLWDPEMTELDAKLAALSLTCV